MDSKYLSVRKKHGNNEMLKRVLTIIHILFFLSFLLSSKLWNILLLYIAVSEFFLRFPFLIHKVNTIKHDYSKSPFGFYLGAHRGGSREGLENTISNFMRAKALGVTFVEMDVCMTKDKKVVVVHDPNLKRICGVDKTVNDFNYDELPLIQDKILLHFSENMYDSTKDKDRRIPLFEDVCRELGNTCINMEMKTADEEMVEEVHRIITKYKSKREVIWGFVDHKNVSKLREIDSSIARFASKREILLISLAFISGFLPFISIDCDSFQSPIYNNF